MIGCLLLYSRAIIYLFFDNVYFSPLSLASLIKYINVVIDNSILGAFNLGSTRQILSVFLLKGLVSAQEISRGRHFKTQT